MQSKQVPIVARSNNRSRMFSAALSVQVRKLKEPLLKKAADKLLKDSKFSSLRREMDNFRTENAWVEDSALFYCLITFQV